MWINAKDYEKTIGVSDILIELPDAADDVNMADDTQGNKFLVTRAEPNLELTLIKRIKANCIILDGLVLEKGLESKLRNGQWLIEVDG